MRRSQQPRDLGAKLRGFAGELGYDLVKLPNRNLWQILDSAGEPIMNERTLAPAFRSEDAVKFLQRRIRDREKSDVR